MDKLAIVILNWNGEALLKKFLPSVIRNSALSKVVVYVADNASSDHSVSYIRNHHPSVKIIQLDKNYGFAEGYNRALKEIPAEYFCLLNSDVEVTPGWIEPVLRILDSDLTIGACQPKIKDYNHKEWFEYAGAAGGFIDAYGYPFCRGRIFHSIEMDHGQYDNPTDIFWASGAALFIRARLYLRSGGLDPAFFAHMEEIDLCWRLKNQGVRIYYVPQSTVYHVGGGTLSQQHPKKTFLNFRNNLYLLYKNAGKKFLRIYFIRILLDFVASVKFFVSGEIRSGFAVIKAHSSFIWNKKQYKKGRKNHIERQMHPSHPEMYTKSIVSQFYLKNRKSFQRLKFIIPKRDFDQN